MIPLAASHGDPTTSFYNNTPSVSNYKGKNKNHIVRRTKK
jgi:hypothetical protein